MKPLVCKHNWLEHPIHGIILNWELQNVIERVTILRAGHTINETDIDHMLHSFETTEKYGEQKGFLTRYEMEKKHIEEALAKSGGVIGGKDGAARLLGIPRSTLQSRIKKLGIDHTSERGLWPN